MTGKRARHRPKKHNNGWRYVVLAFFVLTAFIGIWLARFDINTYRPSLQTALSEQFGREIKLGGKITWALSLDHGLSLAIADVGIANPTWASRPAMASIGEARLKVNVRALLRKEIDVLAFELRNADVRLENNGKDSPNWILAKNDEAGAKDQASKSTQGGSAPIAFHVRKVTVSKSRFSYKGPDGALSLFDVAHLSYEAEKKGMKATFDGLLAQKPVRLTLAGGDIALLGKQGWPFRVSFQTMGYDGKAEGKLAGDMKRVELSSYTVSSGKTKASGRLNVFLGGVRPAVSGTLQSDLVYMADLSGGETKVAPSEAGQGGKTASGPSRFFSDEPIDLSGLSALDLDLDAEIGVFELPQATMTALKAPIRIKGGRLALDPLTAKLGESAVKAQVTLDASGSRPDLSVVIDAPSVDLSQFVRLGGVESMIGGKSDLDIQIKTSGHSMHDFAAHANGAINLLMDKGTLEPSVIRSVAGSLIGVFVPGASDVAEARVNCAAGRWTLTQGIMETKGLLIDTNVTTLAGTGYINLADERMNMSLRTKPKKLGLGNLVPSMNVRGSMTKPSVTPDSAEAIGKVASMLGGKGTTLPDGVPVMVTPKPGENACAATLDRPASATIGQTAAPVTSGPAALSPEPVQRAKDQFNSFIKNLGKGIGK